MLSRRWDPGIGDEVRIGVEDQQRKDQSQLLGNGGDMKDGETARKRMKILVPHFDNSALIKTYSKTLVGRCMNPAE
ncbi:hypothetical protein Bca4012_030872 [Brassica carinata]